MTNAAQPKWIAILSATGSGRIISAKWPRIEIANRASIRLRRPLWHDPERAALFQPRRALVAHQRAADFSGIVAQADSYDLKTFRMLVAAQPIGEEAAHGVGNRLRIGRFSEVEDGVDALSKFRIGQADDNAGTHFWMCHPRGLDFGRIDICTATQNHVGEPVAEIEVAVSIEPADIAERFPAVGPAFWFGTEIVIGGAGA